MWIRHSLPYCTAITGLYFVCQPALQRVAGRLWGICPPVRALQIAAGKTPHLGAVSAQESLGRRGSQRKKKKTR